MADQSGLTPSISALSGISFPVGLFIDNEYVRSSSQEALALHNPFDGSLITDDVQVASSEDVDKAVESAQLAFQSWRKTSGSTRSAIMHRYADLLEEKVDELAKLETVCMGAPIALAKHISKLHIESFRYYAGLIDKVPGEVHVAVSDGSFKMINYEPLGVCAGIGAWNAGLLFAAWKIAPAIAAGNTVVFKSSEKSPLSVLYLGTIIKKAGFPPGVINLISGGPQQGNFLSSHMGISKISFTGSREAGRQVQIAAAQSNMKLVTLELGGKSAALIFDDCNLQNAILHNSQGFLLNNAQVCSAASRILVHEDIAETFIDGLKKAFVELASMMGNPATDTTFLGPLVDDAHLSRVKAFISEAEREGIEIWNASLKMQNNGCFAEPTILIDPPASSRAYREDIFGPVVAIKVFKTEDEAISMANDSPFGLSGTIFTSNFQRALRVASQLNVGMVSINSAHEPSIHTTWGGWKQSGYGRESSLHAIKEFLQTKAVHINVNVPDF